MRQLRLVGLNEDGSRLVLRDEGAKADYLLPVDERLSAALRGDRARLGQLEITLESQLRPREMQSRVRAGESPQQVAEVAGLPLDRVLRFVAPVIAEREHVVEQALRAAVRRAGGDGPGPVLEPTVLERLAARGVTVTSVGWDAWRRDDGRWTVQVSYSVDERERSAQWVYDAGAQTVVALDDEARAITGNRPPPAPVAAVDADAPFDHELLAWDSLPPRLAPVPDATGPNATGPNATGPNATGPDAAASIDGPDSGRSAHERDATLAHAAQSDPAQSYPAQSYPGELDASGDDDERELTEARAVGRSSRRAHVPSWDEIMFGRRRARD